MATQVKIWTKESDFGALSFYSKVKVLPNETHASLRVRLEEKSAMDWPFEFWDIEDSCRIPQKMEDLIDVIGDVYILPMRAEAHEACKRRRLDDDGAVGQVAVEGEDFALIDENRGVQIDDPVASSRVTGTSAVIESLEHQLHSTLLDAEIWQRYVEQAEKMKRDLRCSSQEDNRWLLRTSYFNGNGVVKIFCVECCKETGGDSGKHDKISIQNLFNNFKSKHLFSTNHIKNWCTQNDVQYADHPHSLAPRGKSIPLTPELHQKLIQEGISIMEEVNESLEDSQKPFSVLQSFKDSAPKSFWMKVRCFYCRDLLGLCPPKKNLEWNLRHHLASSKHVQAVEQSKTPQKGKTALLSGRRGRPTLSSGVSVHYNQPHLGRWWQPHSTEPTDNNPGESSTLDRNAVFGLLCWGFRDPTATYASILYPVRDLLNDPHAGDVWYPEPHTTVVFSRSGSTVEINGTFRHKSCSRFTPLGNGFPNLCCSMCAGIPLLNDFRKRVVREYLSLEKRGTRGTGAGRRLGYLSVFELAKHGREISKKLKAKKLLHLSARARIVQLKVKRPSLREMAREVADGHNVMKFCHSIINAHRAGAFGGKPALWDFLCDVVCNVNRDDRGNRFSDNSKCLAEVMKVYGGRRMVDLFAQNFGGQSYTQVKRDTRKGVHFIAGEYSEIFSEVAQIYRDAKVAHNIVGPVPVILAKDETKVKGRVAWEPKSDTLAGFCGPSVNHVCRSGFMPIVGSGEEGYQRLVDSFANNRTGSFARVIVVNPLHSALPRLVLVACCTCNCFNATWVRNQWEKIDELWKKDCLNAVGPIIGHASDGDSRRRQLMLADYKSDAGLRLHIGWDGWMFKASLDENGDASGLHDQDYIHNGKKLINPLLSAARTLQLGGDLCLHSHIELVFHQFKAEDHGLKLQDVERRDRQNWAAAQRLCQSRVRSCLSQMRAADYPHPERTLGNKYYLEICAAYIDIFCSVKLDLRSRIVLCGKVFFFFRIWRLWLLNGDHSVMGNSQRLVEAKNFISLQCFLDIQLSCHFVVLLICHFRDKFPELVVPLHLTGSDSCEIFFSRIGGMNGHERAYDFHELVNTANTLNRMSATEYGTNGLAFKKQHNKMDNIWESLHKLEPSEERCDLGDYSLISDNASVIAALQEGLKQAQQMLRALNMAPSVQCQPRLKIWFEKPWLIERSDPRSFAYTPSARLVAGEDGDSEVLRDRLQEEATVDQAGGDAPEMSDSTEDDIIDDGLNHMAIVEEETRDAISDVLNSGEVQVSKSENATAPKIQPTVELEGHCIYKSTLVSQLNGNNFLSKDRLARIKQTIKFNNHDNCVRAGLSSGTGLLCVGSDCGVHFVQRSTTRLSSAVRSTAKRKRGRPPNASGGDRATNILHAVDEGAWWVGRVQAMRRRNGRQFGVLRQPVDLLARLEESGKPKPQNPYIEVMLQYYRKSLGRDKFKYDHTDSKWIDVDCIISTVTMTYNPVNEVYTLDRNDSELLTKFVNDRNT